MTSLLIKIQKAYVLARVFALTFWCMMKAYFSVWTGTEEQILAFNARLTHYWGTGIAKILNIQTTFKGSPISTQATLFVGNHMSYLDIPLFFTLRNATFVAKKEVSKWPIVGVAATSVGTVYVDRNSLHSRAATAEAMRSAIKDRGQSIVIFPEGTSSLSGKPWRQGALRMAQDADLWVQPFVIHYHPARPAAYIDDDHLVSHLWNWVVTTPLNVQIYFFEPRKVQDYSKETKEIQILVQNKWQELQNQCEAHQPATIGAQAKC